MNLIHSPYFFEATVCVLFHSRHNSSYFAMALMSDEVKSPAAEANGKVKADEAKTVHVDHRSLGSIPPKANAFLVVPQEIVFRSFKENMTYEATVSFKNISGQSQHIRVCRPNSQVFSLTAPKAAETSLKVASGLDVSYKIQFRPDANKDYHCDLRVVTPVGETVVPLRAFGDRGKLDLPDKVKVPPCPVKGARSTTLFLRNNEKDECVWKASIDPPYAIFPSYGIVPGDGGLGPVEIVFSPLVCGHAPSIIQFFLGPEGDLMQELPVSGNGVETSIQMEPSEMVFCDTYVTRERQIVVTVSNPGDIAASFCWKREAVDSDEALEREIEGRGNTFSEDAFSIEPCSGVIYAKGLKEFTVTFNPQLAVTSTTAVYLEIVGKSARIPLTLTGTGVGPECKLEYPRLNVGNIFLNETHEYECNIVNNGCIAAVFTVLPSTTDMGKMFTFYPVNGVLAPSESQLLTIRLRSDKLGCINEVFRINLHGSLTDLTLQFKGRVLGPTYHFDVHELDFGNVSYNFWHSRIFSISNTSRIAMQYSLHLPEGSPFAEEFVITPSKGIIDPEHSQLVQVEFLSNTAGEYDTSILMDMESIGEAVDCLPLKAVCVVPPLYLPNEKLSYGRCFVGYDYTMNLEVANDTPICGKFEITMSDLDGVLEKVDIQIGDRDRASTIEILEPHRRKEVPVTLRVLSIGNINFALNLRVLGSTLESQAAIVTAVGRGPELEVQPPTLQFGKTRVLQEVEKQLTLANTSPIPATVTLTLLKSLRDHRNFQVSPTDAVIEPFGKQVITVKALLDEAMVFKDLLEINVKHAPGSIAPVAVRARGFGCALVPNVDLHHLHLGDVFTDSFVSKEVIITNQGRKNQEIQWLNKRGNKAKEGAPPITFTVQPERAVIAPRTSCSFTLSGSSMEKGERSENFYIKQAGVSSAIFNACVAATFIPPLIQYSSKSLAFEFIQGQGDLMEPQMKTFTMKNTTDLEIEVVLRIRETKSPFRLEEPTRFKLQKGETHVVGVFMHPGYRGDYFTHTAKSKILVSFVDLPQTDAVGLVTKILFPSVKIEPEGEVLFGSIMRDTESRSELLLHNESNVIPAVFHWRLLKLNGEEVSKRDSASNTVPLSGSSSLEDHLKDEKSGENKGALEKEEMDAVKIFDFVPFAGTVPPGGTQRVEAIFYGHAGQHEATATCAVKGGPSSEIKLCGSAGEVQIHYDRTSLDFGVIPYYTSESKYITISNPSRVVVNFVVTTAFQHSDCFKISPTSGKIKDRLRLKVTFTPRIPEELAESFSIHVGHFDPQVVKVIGRGQVNTAILLPLDSHTTLTRVDNETFKALYKEKRETDRMKIVPYLTKTSGKDLPSFLDPILLEAERQAFAILVRGAPSKRRASSKPGTANGRPREPSVAMEGSVLLDETTYPLYHQLRRSSASAKGSVKPVLSRYLLDLGHMTRNEKQTMRLTVLNTCSENLYIFLDAKDLVKTPLTINPVKLPKLGPLADAVIEVTLDATHNGDEEDYIRPGENSFEFALDIKEGPVIVVECICYVATPTLKLSQTSLDFGSVIMGRCKILPLSLQNDQAVPCEWRLQCKEEKVSLSLTPALETLLAQSPQFWVNLDHGVLSPHSSTVLEVFFSPIVEQQGLMAMLTFRFMSNPKSIEVKLRGSGKAHHVTLSPSPFVLPVVRPVQVTHQTLRITNHENHPVMVYACGLDSLTQYEKQLLESCLCMMEGRRLLYPLRVPGEGLNNDLLSFIYKMMHEVQKKLRYAGEDSPGFSSLRQFHVTPSESAVEEQDACMLTEAVNAKLPAFKPFLVLLLGPPQSGKTTQARLLQERLGFVSVNFNSLIAEEAEKDTAIGEILRNLLSLRFSSFTPPEGTTMRQSAWKNSLFHSQDELELTAPLANAQLFFGRTMNQSVLSNPFGTTIGKDGIGANSGSFPVGGLARTGSNGVTGGAGGTGMTNATLGSTMGTTGGKSKSGKHDLSNQLMTNDPAFKYYTLLPNILRQLFRMFFRRCNAVHTTGYIMDDLECTLGADRVMLYNAVKELCESMGVPLHVVTLSVSEPTAGLRYATALHAQCQERVEEFTILPVSEEMYDAMSPSERLEYNVKLKHYNECVWELKAARKQMEKYEKILAEGTHSTIQSEVQDKCASTLAPTSGRSGKKGGGGQRHSVNAAHQMGANAVTNGGSALTDAAWRAFSPLETFKELYMHLLKTIDDEEDEEKLRHSTIPGEQPPERLRDAILSAVLQRKEEDPLLGMSPSRTTSQGSSSKSSSERESANRFGEWQFIDFPRLRYDMSHWNVDYIRFFSMVERKLLGKKNPKAKVSTATTLVQRHEEMTRWLIPPHSYVDVMVEFCSDRIGKFSLTAPLGVVGSLQTLDLNMLMQVSLPDMVREDKEIFFASRFRLAAGKNPGKVFVTSKRMFDFGPLLVPCPVGGRMRMKGNKDRASANRAGTAAAAAAASVVSGAAAGGAGGSSFHGALTTAAASQEGDHRPEPVVLGSSEVLRFSNRGISPADVQLNFFNEKDKTFTVTPNRFVLEVNGTQEVTLRAAPENVGEFHNCLIAVVKDNPIPWKVNICCIGSRPSLTVNGQKEAEVDFGKEVINRFQQRTIALENTSRMAIQWRIVGAEKLPVDFKLEESCGLIDENCCQTISIIFSPLNTCLYTLPLQISVTDPNVPSLLYEMIPVLVKAEGHDVVLEWTKEVDFKLMHVGETKKEAFRMMNKSPYDVGFLFRVPQRLNSFITVVPQTGVIRGMMGYKDSAIATAEITAHFDREGEIPKRLAQMELSFFDPQANALLYPVQNIPIRGEAWHTKFSVKPENIDFGSCFFHQRKQSTLEVRNTGRFPVFFTLFDYNAGCQDLITQSYANLAQEQSEEQSVATGSKKVTKGKQSEGDFHIGCFTVSPSHGVVQVGEVMTLIVVTVPSMESRTKEVLGVFVELSGPELEAKGLPIELSAHPATPGIAADLTSQSDVETIFEEQQVLPRLHHVDKTLKAYGKEAKTFSYGTVLVGHESVERFRIANTSPLPCNVMVQLQSGNGPPSKSNVPPECFEIVSNQIIVDKVQGLILRFTLSPFESRFVLVEFKPSSLQHYEARFVAIVENGTDPKNNLLCFHLMGIGTLPNVEYILPPSLVKPGTQEMVTPKSAKRGGKESSKKFSSPPQVHAVNDAVDMPLTRVGATSSRFFSIRNTGEVPAEVRVVMLSDECFTDSGLSVNRRNVPITVPVGGEESFEILYTPVKVAKSVLKFRVFVEDNPFENKEITVEGQSFAQDISFDNIDPAFSDFLSLGDCYLEEPKSVEFGLRNNTDKDFRFTWTWPSNEGVMISPSEGHLRANQCKTITATVVSPTIVLQRHVPCEVQLTSIQLMENVDWDNSMMSQKWIVVEDDRKSAATTDTVGRRNLQRIMEPLPEPDIRMTGEDYIIQPLQIGYSCDKPSFDVLLVNTEGQTEAIECISFPKTKMYHRRIVTLRIVNTGGITLPYHLIVSSPPSSSLAALPFRDHLGVGGRRERDVENNGSDFYVDRPQGMVPISGCHDVKVYFAPRCAEMLTGTLKCEFPHSDCKPIYIPLSGLGECPLVHFSVPDTDYLANRVDGEAGEITDPETVIVEVVARGLHSSVVKKFKVINPTISNHQFEWNECCNSDSLSPFRCLTPSGTISAGKQFEMAFEFSANTLGLRECKWSFNIFGKAVVPFVFVGKAAEPDVLFSTSKMNFGTVLVGAKSEQVVTLENQDNMSFGFTFDKAILATTPFLTVKPLQGVIGPKEKLPISITFIPRDEMEYNIPVVCAIKKSSTPLTINIKGEGFNIHERLVMELPGADEEPVILDRNHPFNLNLGSVQLFDKVTRRFLLTNTCQYPFDYVVQCPARRFVEVTNIAGSVLAKSSTEVTLTYSPMAEETLRGYRVVFRISDRPAYQIICQATSYIPKVDFSFQKFDFGPRFIAPYDSGNLITSTLTVTNYEKELVTVDCNLSEGNEWLEVDTSSFVLKPNEAVGINFTFSPKLVGTYDDQLKLLVNGVYPSCVSISGEGVVPRVEVLNHFCKLGTVRVGERREVEVRLECRSRIPTPVSFVGCLDEDMARKGVSIPSGMTYVLKPREVRPVHILFNPQRRMGAFQRELKMLVCDREVPFALVTGACEDSEIHLDNTVLKFTDVVVGSSCARKIVIMNSGEISQKFNWNFPSAAELTVSPVSGFVRSHTEFICEIIYHPTTSKSVLQRSIQVEFDSSPPIAVTLEGNGASRPPAKGVLRFRCAARTKQEVKLSLDNSSLQPWTFPVVVDHPLFSAPSTVTIKPRGRVEVPFTYAPLKANLGSDPDLCTVFIPFADGSGQTYELEGVSEEPGPAGPPVEITVETKATGHGKFQVFNWHKQMPLRFARSIEWIEAPPEGLCSIKGQSGVVVPPDSSKEYCFSIQCMREGVYHGRITFQSPERMDFSQYYQFTIKVVHPATTETIVLESQVRSGVTHSIPVFNPLQKSLTLTVKAEGSADGLTFPPTVVIPAKSDGVIPIEFFPLVHKEYHPVKIVWSSPDLGAFTFTLKLISSPPSLEKITALMCPLGQSTTFMLRFTHFSKTNTDFSVGFVGEKLNAHSTPSASPGASSSPAPGGSGGSSSPSPSSTSGKTAVFSKVGAGNTIKAAPTTRPHGQELITEFVFEPQWIGNVKEVIEFSSPLGGVYTFPIWGTCTPPQRQGPFKMKPGQSTPVPFKNVFSEPISICVTTDSPHFVVMKKSESVAAKKTVNIIVQCKSDDQKKVVRGKLLISCIPPGEKKSVEWVFYLEGGGSETFFTPRRPTPRGVSGKRKFSPLLSKGK